MSALHAHQALRASAERRAVAKATRRHVHVSDRPFVLTGYHLAGDPGAPMALLWGTNPSEKPRCVVVPEPRNRALRFRALGEFADAFLAYLDQFAEDDGAGVCADAPQVVVPNGATAEWLGGIVGRFTRNLRLDGDAPPPASVPLTGKHLSFFGDLQPGSCLMLAATDALAVHWQTGQLPSEDLNLAAVLGWIEPRDGLDGPAAARRGESQPPAGPDSDPNWDADFLAELIRSWHASSGDASAQEAVREELEERVREQLTPAWLDCWRALDLLGTVPAGDHVASRWSSDRTAWTTHRDRIAEDRAFFRNVPTPVQAATRLRMLETRTEQLQREMAWDDPLVMASLVASGEALAGRVVVVDSDRRTLNASGRSQRRPLIAIDPALAFARPTGTDLYLSTHPSVKLQVLANDATGMIRVEVVRGANQSGTVGLLPAVGDEIVLSPYGRPEFYQRSHVDEIPWTHVLHDDDDNEDV